LEVLDEPEGVSPITIRNPEDGTWGAWDAGLSEGAVDAHLGTIGALRQRLKERKEEKKIYIYIYIRAEKKKEKKHAQRGYTR
jgi:hypothetical protein